MESNDLNGLPLGVAFRKHVLECDEVRDVGCRLMQEEAGYAQVFVDGQAPGLRVDFHWPIRATPESIAFQFVRSPAHWDANLPEPSELIVEASRALAGRTRLLVDRLLSGEIVAVGTFAATGVERPIGAGQWMRQDLSIDTVNSALCETRDRRRAPLWTGVRLTLPDICPSSIEVADTHIPSREPEKARAQIKTKDKSKRELTDWLIAIMADANVEPCTREKLWEQVTEKWPGNISKRAFISSRDTALGKIPEDRRYAWERPGPKLKSPRSNRRTSRS